jgi:opacity protein-like surface antigen
MKNLLLTFATLALILTFSTNSFAQAAAADPAPASGGGALKTDAGTLSLGLFVGDSFLNLGGGAMITLSSFTPTFGYFVIPNLEANFSFVYGSDTTDHDGGGSDTDSMFGISIGANYYIPFRGKLNMVAGGAIVYYSTEHEQEAGGTTVSDETTSMGINLKFGLSYAFSQNLAIEGGVKLFYISTDYENNDEEGYFGLQLGYFGVKGYF